MIKKEDENLEPVKFHSLSPIKDAEVAHYINALNWALDNRKKEGIHNIALTGPYGSGKSSILQTFKSQNKNSAYEFLEISLATFKEEEVYNKSGEKKDEDVLRLIELSILQQIFYHEEDEKIPDSRFKKIKSFNRKAMYWITAGIMAALIFGINLFFPEIVEKTLDIQFGHAFGLILHWLSLLVFLAAFAVITFRSIRVLYGVKISKLKFQEAEIEIDKGISKSILNNHLDEILYFFEVTPYSVVLIEDLDRFRQAEIFTKLRELNQLINNSKKIKNKEVVFIYAVRDEMFSNKDRTKFFDFIIPVIPVINSSNSNEKLTKLISENKYEISPDLVEDISLFIDDMRLLYNITNEYGIYHDLLDKKLDQDKLLAMIVYKNVYPDDFVILETGKGKLYELLNSRNNFIKEAIQKIDDSIKTRKQEIKDLQRIALENSDELRLLYISHFADKINDFKGFQFNGSSANLKDAATEANFEYFKTSKFSYQYFQYNYSYYILQSEKANFDFAKFQIEVDPDNTYKKRLTLITDISSGKSEQLKQEIDTLEKRIVSIRHLKLKDILSDKTNTIVLDTSNKQGQLLNLLIRSGYINEDYLDYISLFYEGSISKDDRDYLLNVKSQQSSEYDLTLNKIANVIEKISLNDFGQSYILNYNIMDYMLVNDGYQVPLDIMLSQLNDSNSYGIRFMDGFIEHGINTEIFMKELSVKWVGIWNYIDKVSNFTSKRKEYYFKLLITCASATELYKIADVSNLGNVIAERSDFLSLIPDEEHLQQVISTLDIHFENIELEKASKSIADFVCKGSYYAINTVMLRKIIAYAGKYHDQTFELSNYFALLESGVSELIAYIQKNLNKYIEMVYLRLEQNIDEPEEYLLALLNDKDIFLKNRETILKRSSTEITILNKLKDLEFDAIAFEQNKVFPSWHNVMDYFSRHGNLDKPVIAYLNDPLIASDLSQEGIEAEYGHLDAETEADFFYQLLKEDNISDESYRLLAKAIPYNYNVAEVQEISAAKMGILINFKIINPDVTNFKELKSFYPEMQFLFLDKFAENVMENLADYSLDANDIKHILHSNAYQPMQKQNIIDKVDPDIIIESRVVLKEIERLLLEHYPYKVPKAILIAILQQSGNVQNRVQLFNMYYTYLNKSDVPLIFATFPGDYKKIGVRFTSPVIETTQENRFLANNLATLEAISNIKEDKKGIKIVNFKHKFI